jgi:hypothetical protein
MPYRGGLDQRSAWDPLSAWITCTACSSCIDTVHRTEAIPQTPLFPVPASEQASPAFLFPGLP